MTSGGKRCLQLVCTAVVFSSLCVFFQAPAAGQTFGYIQHNLVSDMRGVAITTDPNLKNPWGIASGPGSPFWISDNTTGLSTLYNGQGQPFPVGSPLVVTIPHSAASTGSGTPDGIVFNGTSNFVVHGGGGSGPAVFLFATEDGTISGWNPTANPTNAIIAVDNSSSGAVYKGLAMMTVGSGAFLFATDFHNNAIRMFDGKFNLVSSFTDPSLPPGFAPFGIANIDNNLYVTFALQQPPDNHDDQAGPGNGFVDVFSMGGSLIKRFASNGTLNSPWGIVQAVDFGEFSNSLLVGNFGDGTINAFDISTGDFLGQLTDTRGIPIFIDGLWG
ncbi:MAG TPA: TIGR03118 family protein, partial [Blastocatellia bacterium]|nr:TIGR03118 family protein [Blastocatellia bacterium]